MVYSFLLPIKNIGRIRIRRFYSLITNHCKGHNYHHDNMWDVFPEQTVDVLSKVEVPIVGFKTLAAGAIHPEDGFRYDFENGADFICVGLFDYQVMEDVNVATAILETGVNRTRPWYA